MGESIRQRRQARILAARLKGPRRLVQVVAGPRQVGKSTLVRQVIAAMRLPCHVASANAAALGSGQWIAQEWQSARLLARGAGRKGAVLVLDEVDRVHGWAEAVGALRQEDTRNSMPLSVVLVGSSREPC